MGRRVPRPTKSLSLHMGTASLDAARRLELQGIDVPVRPRIDVPDLPEDITSESDADLMSLFVRLSRWSEYMGTQLAVAQVDEKYADATLEKMRALSAVANKTEKTVTAAKARAYEDDEFVGAQDAYHAAYAYRKMIEAVYNNTERKSSLVSRELTRRVGRNDRDNRAAGRFGT